jgi:hypothetical protein
LYDTDAAREADSLCEHAAEYGHLHILEWLLNHGATLDSNLLTVAARGNQVETVKWLWTKDCPVDSGACAGAAHCGNLEMLKWLRKNRAPWDISTYIAATRRFHQHDDTSLVQWICSGESYADFLDLQKIAEI